MHSIRVRITAITIVAILTSILFVFAASFQILRSETDQNSVRMMNLIGEDTRKSLGKYFESVEQSVEIIANTAIEDLDTVFLVENGALQAADSEKPRTPEQTNALDAYLRSHCAGIQSFFAGVADYTQGVSAYYYCISPEISQNERGFFYLKIGKAGFFEQEPLYVERLLPSENLNATWYEAAVSRGRPAWIGPYISVSEGDIWICSFFVPIYKAGTLIGVMGMDIPCDTLIAQVSGVRIYDTGYVSLLDENGRVIYHPDLPVGGDLNELGLSLSTELLLRENSGDELFRYEAEGEERQMSFCTLSNGMKLVSVAPAREINTPWIQLKRAILMISALVVAVYVVLLLLLIGAITLPLKQLTKASSRLANADYDVDLDYRGRDEIGILTGAFKQMRGQVRKYIADLNHQLYHDRLTDLPNMRHFFTLAEELRVQMLADGQQSVMVYFDIIGLRHYNRQYGFEKGDRLIVDFADILRRQFGDHRICRFNGDHFAAVTDEGRVGEELQAVLRQCETVMDGQRLSIRVGVYPNRLEVVDVNIACDRAKLACDQNKGSLTSTITWFDEKMLKNGEIYRHIISNLDRALTEGWVKVYYQPIIRAANGRICDEEALARWIDPTLGFLSPAYFIPALEESKLIYKLDLYVLEQILEKMKQQAEAGLYVVPQSVNLSRMDFESCDVVEEIRRRVDAAGIDHSMITVEITESVIGGDFEFMKEQVARFRELGFSVWMDDFGSGYSSMNVLQQIHFDLIKFDMRFMEHFDEGDESKIILTELMNMAISLGMETVCEGVEQAQQVEFLREIGCTRIQGYYYGKPMPFEGIVSLFEKGTALEYENPAEAAYYAAIGSINLYDISALSAENDESLTHYFNTLPMCIMEVNGTKAHYNRCNRSYRDFLERSLGVQYDTREINLAEPSSGADGAFFKAVFQCSRDGNRVVLDQKLNENTVAHTLIRRVAVNPVTGTAAVALAVLAVIEEAANAGASYGQVAIALASDYVDLYYVNLDTEEFIEYSPVAELEDLAIERHGGDFFAASRRDAMLHLYAEDRESFIKAFTKKNVVNVLDTEGQFKLSYRLLIDGKPTYVGIKAVRLPGDRTHMIVSVTDVDEQMRQKEALSLVQAEKIVYARMSALMQNTICIYTVDPVTGHYSEFRASSDYAGLGIPREGSDFFAESLKECERVIYPEDLLKVQTLLNRENILEEVVKNGFYTFRYRLMINGAPRYVSLKAVQLTEHDCPVLVIGINDVDALVKREQDYEQKLFSARNKANLDTLTGVKSKAAYRSFSEHLSQQIAEGQSIEYAIVLCRVDNLAQVNAAQGRPAGDQLIQNVCAVVCDTFVHCPVFRVAGDQFAVIVRGDSLRKIKALSAEMAEAFCSSGLSVSHGVAKYDGTESAASVFARAERLCFGE